MQLLLDLLRDVIVLLLLVGLLINGVKRLRAWHRAKGGQCKIKR
jgi:hypothetical protein